MRHAVLHFTQVRGGGLPPAVLHRALTDELLSDLHGLEGGEHPRNIRDAATSLRKAMLAGRMDKECLGVIVQYLHSQRTPNKYGK